MPIASALYGGETYTKHFEKCDKLGVLIEANITIDNGEYIIDGDCYQNETNFWICNCSDNYDFNFTTRINTINYYNLTFDYNYTHSESGPEQQDSQSGGGSSGGGISYNCNLKQNINSSYCKDEFCVRYLELQNCSKTPASLHLCCKTYFKNDTIPLIDEAKEEIKEEKQKEQEPEPQSEEPQNEAPILTKNPAPESQTGTPKGIIWFIVVILLGSFAVAIYILKDVKFYQRLYK